jgi:thymidine kinase
MALGIYADEITELKSVCDCGKKASFNMRVDADGNRVREGEQVVIGDACYVQKCPVCFLVVNLCGKNGKQLIQRQKTAVE